MLAAAAAGGTSASVASNGDASAPFISDRGAAVVDVGGVDGSADAWDGVEGEGAGAGEVRRLVVEGIGGGERGDEWFSERNGAWAAIVMGASGT